MLPDPPPLAAPALGTVLRGGYELVRFLGAGGMGAVYEGRRPDGARVAVKVLLGEVLKSGGLEVVKRFKREASLGRALESPHILSVAAVDFDPTCRVPFLVMPLLSGLDAESLVDRVGAIHPTVAVRIIRQACQALRPAHDMDVIHRDIKPANLFLEHAPSGRVVVRVLDFGIAKCRTGQAALTQTGSVMGTAAYMAPEQMLDTKKADAQADIWSLGASLYELLSSVIPYGDANGYAALHIAKQTKAVAPLQDFAPWVDPGLAQVVHGALLRDKAARCPSITELYEALGPHAFGSDELTATMLGPVPVSIRSVTARRAAPSDRWVRVEPAVAPGAPVEETAADPLLDRWLARQYRLVRRLGQGGMGSVYEAQSADGSWAAVKVIDLDRAGRDETARRRFVREAQSAASITHDNVVRILNADTDHELGLPFIVMELLVGASLQTRIERHGPIAPRTAARLMFQAALGIGAAHERHLVHRDIKPGNLFLHEDPSGRVLVKVCDFGIAKLVARDEGDDGTASLTRTGGVVGSPMYMSPEQAKSSKQVDLRTDIWSLGVTFYEAIAGVPPWQGRTTVGELILAICTERLVPLTEVAPWAPPELAAVITRAMCREPEGRFGSMQELAEALWPLCGGAAAVSTPMLDPVGETTRARAATVLDASASGALTPAVTHRNETAPPKRSKTRRALPALVLGGAVLVAGSIVVVRRATAPSSATSPESSATQAGADAAPAPSAVPSGRPTASGEPSNTSDAGSSEPPASEPAASGNRTVNTTPAAKAGKGTAPRTTSGSRPATKPTATAPGGNSQYKDNWN